MMKFIFLPDTRNLSKKFVIIKQVALYKKMANFFPPRVRFLLGDDSNFQLGSLFLGGWGEVDC